MIGKTYILVDEKKDASKYIVCYERQGEYSIKASGIVTNPDELRDLQRENEGSTVHIDCAFMGTPLEAAARHYKWELFKGRNGVFPYIEAMIKFCS